ncbi:unnamed protein product, partial [Amoebophrya sp. A25]
NIWKGERRGEKQDLLEAEELRYFLPQAFYALADGSSKDLKQSSGLPDWDWLQTMNLYSTDDGLANEPIELIHTASVEELSAHDFTTGGDTSYRFSVALHKWPVFPDRERMMHTQSRALMDFLLDTGLKFPTRHDAILHVFNIDLQMAAVASQHHAFYQQQQAIYQQQQAIYQQQQAIYQQQQALYQGLSAFNRLQADVARAAAHEAEQVLGQMMQVDDHHVVDHHVVEEQLDVDDSCISAPSRGFLQGRHEQELQEEACPPLRRTSSSPAFCDYTGESLTVERQVELEEKERRRALAKERRELRQLRFAEMREKESKRKMIQQ